MLKAFAWDFGQEFDRLQQEINRVFGRYSDPSGGGGAMRPALRGQESEEGWRIALDMPGVPKETVEIEVQDRTLRIRGERATLGRHAGYQQVLSLPDGADADGITADHRDGVLEVFVPKRQQVRPRRIEVGAGAQPQLTVNAEQPELVGAGT